MSNRERAIKYLREELNFNHLINHPSLIDDEDRKNYILKEGEIAQTIANDIIKAIQDKHKSVLLETLLSAYAVVIVNTFLAKIITDSDFKNESIKEELHATLYDFIDYLEEIFIVELDRESFLVENK